MPLCEIDDIEVINKSNDIHRMQNAVCRPRDKRPNAV